MYHKEPNCFNCCPVELAPENEMPFLIWQQTRNQLIMAGMDGTPIDIHIPAVKIVMDLYGVGDSRRVFDKVLIAARSEIHAIHEKKKEERQASGK